MVDSWCSVCHPHVPVLTSLTLIERNNQGVATADLAERLASTLSALQQRAMLVKLLRYEFDSVRRARCREVEVRATNSATLKSRTVASAWEEKHPWAARRSTIAYQRWNNAPDRHLQRAKADPEYDAYWREVNATDDPLSFESWKVERALYHFREATKNNVILELTEELLTSHFKLSDGTQVTWGTASAAQHFDRVQTLLNQAQGSVETAHRHKAAITLLDKAKAANLNAIAETR